MKAPDQIDYTVAELKLKAMGISIDKLNDTQEEYLANWAQGT